MSIHVGPFPVAEIKNHLIFEATHIHTQKILYNNF